MSACSSILVGSLDSTTWVHVEGRAGQDNCKAVKQYLRNQFDAGERKFVIDLGKCDGIDSTFIGILYRLAADIEDTGETGGVDVIGPCERNERSICKLGLNDKLHIKLDCSSWEDLRAQVKEVLQAPPSVNGSSEKEQRSEMIFDAHDALASANDENERRFRDVLDFLRQDMQSTNEEDDDHSY